MCCNSFVYVNYFSQFNRLYFTVIVLYRLYDARQFPELMKVV